MKLGFQVDGAAALLKAETAYKKIADQTDELDPKLGGLGDEFKGVGESAQSSAKGFEASGKGMDALSDAADLLKDTLSTVAGAFAIHELIDNVNEAEQAFNKLQSQTGKSAAEMLQMKDSVTEIYTHGMGQSLEEVSDSLALVNQQFKGMDTESMELIANDAMVFCDTFDGDINETLRGVSALMTNMGLTAEEAFDYIVTGAQNGLDKSGELTDNIAEYSQLWAQAGFSAEEMFTVLQNGLDSGAYNLDKVNDFVKEFSISLSDGRIAENIDSFSERTQDLFVRWQVGTASQKEVFQSVIADLSAMTNQQEALSIASNVWSALGEDNAMKVITSLNNTSAAYQDVEGAMQSINEIRYNDFASSLESLKRSAGSLVTETLEPALSWLTQGLSSGLEDLRAFTAEHKALTAGMTAATVAAGVLTTGLIAVSGAIRVVKASCDALSISTGGVLKIAGLVVGGVAALAGIASGLSKASDEVEDYDGTLEECRDEIDLTGEALEKAKKRYGENSATVQSLQADLDKLNKQYEKGGGYLGELQEKSDQAAESMHDLQASFQEQCQDIDATETSGYRAVSMLEALRKKSDKTNEDLNLMQSYADYLNDTFQCNIEVNYDTGELTGFDPQIITQNILSAAEEKKIQAANESLSSPEFLDSYTQQYEALRDIISENEDLTDEYIQYCADAKKVLGETASASDIDYYIGENLAGWGFLDELDSSEKILAEATNNFNAADDSLRELCGTVDETGGTYETLSKALKDGVDATDLLTDATDGSTDAMDAQAEGVAEAQAILAKYGDDLYELSAAYDEAYESAYESFSGQFGLFDTAQADAESTVSAAQAAMNSQLEFWNAYNSNLEVLKSTSAESLGITQENYDALMTYAQSGTEEAAGLASSIVYNLQSGNDEAVVQLANTIGEVDSAQQQAAELTAEWQTGLDEAMNTTIGQMQKDVANLDLSAEAQGYANSTMDGYISGIYSRVGSARAAAQSFVDAIQSVLSGAGLSIGEGGISGAVAVQANASGTTDAANVFLAGEEGPELIVGMQGSTVFPAQETEKIVRAVSEYADFSGGYTMEGTSMRNYSNMVSYAPQFSLYLSGGTTDANQKKVKQWVQGAVDDAFSKIIRAYPPVYQI